MFFMKLSKNQSDTTKSRLPATRWSSACSMVMGLRNAKTCKPIAKATYATLEFPAKTKACKWRLGIILFYM